MLFTCRHVAVAQALVMGLPQRVSTATNWQNSLTRLLTCLTTHVHSQLKLGVTVPSLSCLKAHYTETGVSQQNS